MPIDDRTKRFDLELPAQANTLKNDVARLRDAMNVLDEKAAILDAQGKVSPEQLKDVVPLLNKGIIDPANLPTDVVRLLPGETTLSPVQLPPEFMRAVFDVAQENLLVDLDAKIGDMAHITGSGRVFELKGVPASNRDNWKESVMTAITKVNGQPLLPANFNGDLQVATPGVNDNITSLTGLNGPLRLGGEGQADYEAVTLGQLKGAMGTSGGASMSGVMNNFIGAVEWFNGSRSALPAGYIPADGQLVSRTAPETKDLWTAVDKGMFSKVSDAEWVNGPSASAGGQYRGKYSTGNGTTTFRVPDLNGMQLNSVRALFLRGDAAGQATTTIGTVGEVLSSAAPNIFGSLSFHGSQSNPPNGGTAAGGASGAIAGENNQSGYAASNVQPGSASLGSIRIDASKSSPVYGRKNANLLDAANEVRPNSVTGIWIIRANGSFDAANSEFNCISSDASAPPANTTVHGGILKSRYVTEGKTRVAASSYANFIWGSAGGTAAHNLDVVAYNADGTVASNATYQFQANGQVTIPRGNTGYANLWNGAAIKIQEWMATAGAESFQSFIGGSASTQGAGYYGGVSYGMMTTGGNAFPKAQISVAARDRDANGNFTDVRTFRFSPTGDIETPYLQVNGVQGMSWAECGNRNGLVWNPTFNIGTTYSFYSMLSYRTATPGGYQTTQHIGQIHGSASAFAQVVWGAWGDADGKYNSRIQIGPNDGSITFVHADPSNPGGYTQTVNMTPASDITLKREIQNYDGQQSLDNIEAMELKTFIFKDDVQNRVRRGVIAQQVEQIDPQYVKTRTYILGEGVERVQKELDSNVLLLDALAAIKVLSARVAELEAKLEP
ncbi:tail fiber domain-containing protein [Salmonella enterica]|nr:tail fiber domain-containing protein [Salmonella enterica]